MILNFVSMFIVIPYLTAEPTIYGIYTVCISFSIFLSYADLGFLGSGQKYAAECYARGEKEEEIKIIGFANFILLIFLILLTLIFVYFSYYPTLLVKDIHSKWHIDIAAKLLFIVAIFTPATLFQRIAQLIFAIRMEDYIIQRINVIGNILKIVSVYFFFDSREYNIVGYYLFCQLTNLACSFFTIFLAKKIYNYNLILLMKSIRFNKNIYFKIKSLAYASLLATLSWILYYEFDTVFIANYLGAKQVAIFSIGLTILSFFRTIFGVLFSPFGIRFNHLIGEKNENGLKELFLKVIGITAPFVIMPILILCFLSNSLILSWLGINFTESIIIVQLLVLCNSLAFITYPTSMLLIAKAKQKQLNFISIIIPVVFWLGVLTTIHGLGLKSIAIFKLLSFLISFLIYLFFLLKELKITMREVLLKMFKPMIWPIILTLILVYVAQPHLPIVKSKINFITNIAAMTLCIIFSLIGYYVLAKEWRNEIKILFLSFFKKQLNNK